MARRQATEQRSDGATKGRYAPMYRAGGIWLALCLLPGAVGTARAGDRVALWQDGKPQCHLVVPSPDEPARRLGQATINSLLRRFYNVELPTIRQIAGPGTYITFGTCESRAALEKAAGAVAMTQDLGTEGFQILTRADGDSKLIIVLGNTPRAIKHACQELVFYRISATAAGGFVDWPLNDVAMKPAFAYRGIYMLPCWSVYDSLESWQRVLRFNSELTLNRIWFWLDGFPVAGHPAVTNMADQKGTLDSSALASDRNVQELIDLVNREDMVFYIGGGWMSWHHERVVGKDPVKAKEFYRAYLRTFRGVGGFYFEPTGEGGEVRDWRPECDSLREFITLLVAERPGFECAVAIGKFNNAEYLRLMSQLDPKRVYWWWCWGDPFRDKALEMYPSVLRWHTVTQMSNFHGSIDPPSPAERRLAGVVTSYDPGMGFGNPWNGWGRLGTDKPRNFDPYDIPYFGHEYFFRERCWNPEMSEADFVRRLHRRLFDADCPAEAGERYWQLTRIVLRVNARGKPDGGQLSAVDGFLAAMRHRRVTPRTADTLARMEAAMQHLRPASRNAPR